MGTHVASQRGTNKARLEGSHSAVVAPDSVARRDQCLGRRFMPFPRRSTPRSPRPFARPPRCAGPSCELIEAEPARERLSRYEVALVLESVMPERSGQAQRAPQVHAVPGAFGEAEATAQGYLQKEAALKMTMPPNVHGLKDVNEAVRPAAASPRNSQAEELADALRLGAYAAEDQKNERWKDAQCGFFAAHSALQRLIQGRPDMPETQKFSLRQIADRYWESATSAGQALRQAAHGVDDALSNPTPTPSPDAGELTPGYGGKGHQLASDGPAPETTEDMRAKRIAALEKLLPAAAPNSVAPEHAAPKDSWVISLMPRAKTAAPPSTEATRGGYGEFYGGNQVLVHAPNDKQLAARLEASAFTGEGHSIAGPRDEGVVAVPPAIHPLAAAAPSSAGATPPPTPGAGKPKKPGKFDNVRKWVVPDDTGGVTAPPLPPTRFKLGERVQCNMGLKDGTYSWLAGIVDAIDVYMDHGTDRKYKYRVKLDDRTHGCVFAPEDTEYFIRAEGGTPTPPSAFGSFRFGVGDSVACLMQADDHQTPTWFPGVVTHVDGWTQGRYYVYLAQLDDGRIAYVPTDSDACCVSKTPKVVVTALGTFSTTHENAVARDALELVQKLLLNVIKHPDEPKFRIVKLANPKLQKLFRLSGGIALMQSLGFEKHANEELELPRIKPIATLTRCHVAVQDALDLLARRAVTTTHAPADSAHEQPMVPARQSTITTEMERLWKAQESANVPMLLKRAKSVRSQLVEDLIKELKPIYSDSSQSERLAIYCAAKAEIQRLESLPVGYSAADLLQQRLDAPSPTQSGVFGTPDAMAFVGTLQVPYNWRKGMTLIFKYEGEEIALVAPEGTQPGDVVMLTLPRRAKPGDGGAPPSPIVFQEEPSPNPESPFNQVQDDGRSLAQALVDRILNQISVSPDQDDIDYRDDIIPKRSISKVASTAAAAVQKELAEAPATDSVWAGDRPVSWSTFLLPADAAARRLFPLANLSSETNIVDPLTGRSSLAWQPPVTCAGTVEPELLRASELHPLSTKGDGNCLLHAAALGAWGVHDQAGTKNVGVLRSMVFNLLNNEQFVRVLLPRMRAEQVSVMTMRPRSRPPPS